MLQVGEDVEVYFVSSECVFLQGGDDFDEDYVVSCEVSAGRAVDDFCFPVHCSRGERRHLLTLARTGPLLTLQYCDD